MYRTASEWAGQCPLCAKSRHAGKAVNAKEKPGACLPASLVMKLASTLKASRQSPIHRPLRGRFRQSASAASIQIVCGRCATATITFQEFSVWPPDTAKPPVMRKLRRGQLQADRCRALHVQCIRPKRIPLATASDKNDSADAAAMPIPMAVMYGSTR
jgi:hypothetical protein